MRGARAKSIRKYVAGNFQYLPEGSLYQQRPDGVIMLLRASRRALYKFIKNNYKRKQRGLEIREGA